MTLYIYLTLAMIFLENKTNSQLHIKQISQPPKHNIKRDEQQKRTFKNILADKFSKLQFQSVSSRLFMIILASVFICCVFLPSLNVLRRDFYVYQI